MKRKYGWRPSLPDHRNWKYTPKKAVPPEVRKIDLRDKCPPIWDQKQLGSCTAFAWARAFQFLLMKEGHFVFEPAHLYIYYYERLNMGPEYVMEDSGASIKDGAVVLSQIGTCSEKGWSYSDDPIKFRIKPPFWCDNSAKIHKLTKYESVAQDKETMKSVLYNEGIPIVIGFSVYESFESDEVAKTGIVPMPGPKESLLGGHAVCVVGFDEDKQHWIMHNSWGEGWGDKGSFYLPYQYLLDPNLADDFWAGQFAQ